MAEGKPRLENKVALITGASRGLGRAMAIRFADEGASIAVNYVKNRELAEDVCRTIQVVGGKAISVPADVADLSQVEAMVAKTLKEFGRIDILVNNGGISIPAPFLDASLTDLDRMIDVNLKGVIHCVRAVARHMMERRYGRILNISSLAGLGTTFPGTTGYAATKAALIVLTKRLAWEFGAHNITVNALAPGFIKTDLSLRPATATGARHDLADVERRTILGRLGEPEDIAHAALFLVSDEASFITAQTLSVDGGRMDFISHSA